MSASEFGRRPAVMLAMAALGVSVLPKRAGAQSTPASDTDDIKTLFAKVQTSSGQIKDVLDSLAPPKDPATDTMTSRLTMDVNDYMANIHTPKGFYTSLPESTNFETSVARTRAVVGLIVDQVQGNTLKPDTGTNHVWNVNAVMQTENLLQRIMALAADAPKAPACK